MRQHVIAALKRVKGARSYAVDQQTEVSLTALATAWLEQRNQANEKFSADALVQFLNQLAPMIPGMLQQVPSAPATKPEPWRDEITGEPAKNPWLTGDLESQGIITGQDPALAAHLQRVAKDGGVSYAYLKELRDAEAKRQTLASLKYDNDEHEANPFRQNNRTVQSEFVRSNPPEVVQFYRDEARPLRLPFSPSSKHLTVVGKIVAHDSTAGRIINRAEQLEETWLHAQVAEARGAEEQAVRKRQEAEALLR